MSPSIEFVYVVTAGEYSDYHIEGVFLDLEAAKKHSLDVGDSREEKYTLGVKSDRGELASDRWNCTMAINGEMTMKKERSWSYWEPPYGYRSFAPPSGTPLFYGASSDSEEEAKARAQKVRQEFIDMKQREQESMFKKGFGG